MREWKVAVQVECEDKFFFLPTVSSTDYHLESSSIFFLVTSK